MNPRLALAVLFAIAATAFGLLRRPPLRLDNGVTSNSPEYARYIATLGAICSFEARLSRGLPGPAQVVGSADLGGVQLLRGEQRPSADARSLAPADVVVGLSKSDRLDRIIDKLETAAPQGPQDARILSDLAAIYLARAANGGESLDLLRALAASEKAWRQQPTLEEALFNRALALEKLYLLSPAQEAWSNYLKADPSSSWSGVARRHLQSLRETANRQLWLEQSRLLERATVDHQELVDVRALTRSFPQSMREYVESRILPAWADEVVERNSASTQRLQEIARIVGVELANRSGDHMIEDTVAAIEEASRNIARFGARDSLVAGHREFRRGLQRYQEGEIGKAVHHFRLARDAFVQGGSEFHYWADFYLALGTYYEPNYAETIRQLARLDSQLGQYPVLRARALWVKGLAQKELGNFTEALDSYTTALELLRFTGEAENIAAVHNLISGVLDTLGEFGQAWEHRVSALALVPQVQSPRRLHNILGLTAEAAARQGELEIALLFQDQVVQNASRASDSLLTAIAYWQRAALQGRLGYLPQAAADVENAEYYCSQLRDDDLRKGVLADIRFVEGHIYEELDLERSLRGLDESIAYYLHTNYRFRLAAGYQRRAAVRRAKGDRGLEREDLSFGIEVIEDQRSKLNGGEHRISYFEQAADIFDAMVLSQIDLGNLEAAFNYAERGRARAMLDYFAEARVSTEERARVLSASAEPMTWREIDALLPKRTCLIEYAILENRVAGWVLKKGRLDFIWLPISAPELKVILEDLYAQVRKRESGNFERASSVLYRALIKPLAHLVPSGATLVFAPDKDLNAVPFAALFDWDASRYLFESHGVELIPSSTLYVLAVERARQSLCRPLGNALVVANPSFSHRRFPFLLSLPGAESEARKVSAVFPETVVLLGVDATPERFWTLAQDRDLIVFAGHALVNERVPLLSTLVLAESNDSSGGLLLRELYGRSLKLARVVVLSACKSGKKTASREALSSLAEGFLAAGASSVVAGLWDVADGSSSRILDAFYQSLRRGDAPVTALRAAQLQSLHSGDPDIRLPASWGAFALFGGSDIATCKEER